MGDDDMRDDGKNRRLVGRLVAELVAKIAGLAEIVADCREC